MKRKSENICEIYCAIYERKSILDIFRSLKIALSAGLSIDDVNEWIIEELEMEIDSLQLQLKK